MGSTDVSRCILNVLLAVLGAGHLTLPYAMHKLGGLWQGAISLVLFTLLSMHHCHSWITFDMFMGT